ncbi:MAG: hypothetical protein IPL61_31825 [Myxococcales bacterium]|nr:hypothetical protein [Myxococcales bacterium]
MWTRRELLRAAGVGAAASVVASLACGRSATRGAAPPRALDLGLRPALHAAVAILATRLREPVAFAQVRRRVRAVVDLLEREVWDETATLVVLAGRAADGTWRERTLDRTDPQLIVTAARALIATAPAGASAPVATSAATDHVAAVATDPAALAVSDWRTRIDDLAARADVGSNSRVVYRATYAITDDEHAWVVSAEVDRHQRLVRSRVGALAVAWHGSAPIAGHVEVAGGFGPETERLTNDELARANRDALALTTPGAFAAQAGAAVILAPDVVAALVERAWPRTATAGVTVVDDPAFATAGTPGYASYVFDGLGRLVAPGEVAERRRRGGPHGRLQATPSNLVVAPGTATDLIASVDDGFVIDGLAEGGGVGDAVAVRATRVRRVARGRLTGHAWRDVELRGSAAAILAATTSVGDRAVTVVSADDDPPRAVVTPPLLTRADLVPARGPT